jgi:hypothetical protein
VAARAGRALEAVAAPMAELGRAADTATYGAPDPDPDLADRAEQLRDDVRTAANDSLGTKRRWLLAVDYRRLKG